MSTPDHTRFMRRALALAQRGWGSVRPNPMVGAVVVREGEIVGEGWHAEHGGPHAEVAALQDAGDRAAGATLYVTLEPCAHHGLTPPCTTAILEAGIAAVVYAAADPNPLARGGAQVLADAGIAVTAEVERAAARRQNAAFFHVHEHNTPWYTLKLATSIDGRIAAADGVRTTLTGEAARAETHRLRSGHDAVLVGIGTALTDDPMLTVRDVDSRRQPTRVVLDTAARLPVGSRLIRSAGEVPVLVLCGPTAPDERVTALAAAGATVTCVGTSGPGLDPGAVSAALLGRGLRAIFVEGGSRVAASFVEAGLVGRIHLIVAPVFLGAAGVPAFSPDVHAAAYRPTVAGKAPGARATWSHASTLALGDDIMLTFDRAEAT